MKKQNDLFLKEARFYSHKTNFLKCNLCPHRCVLNEGVFGLCGVRFNSRGKLYALTYGRPVSISIDPIEKKPLFHFFPGEKILSLGTIGCNLNCKFCQNFEISMQKFHSVKNLMGLNNNIVFPEEIVNMAEQHNINFIAHTYNEPTIFYEYSFDIAKLSSKKGIKNVWVSNGFINRKPLKSILKYVDAFNIDLKSFEDSFYVKYTSSRLNPILKTLKTIFESGKWLEISFLLIPDLNDSEENIRNMAKWIKQNLASWVPIHILAFFPCYKMKNHKLTTLKDLERAYDLFKSEGLEYVYLGNAFSEKTNTFCPKCGVKLVDRTFYVGKITNNLLIDHSKNKAFCKKCGYEIKGVWG